MPFLNKYLKYLLLLIFLLFFLDRKRLVTAYPPAADSTQEYIRLKLKVVFADPNLEKAIREELNVMKKITKYC